MYDLIIKNAIIYDGSGAPAFEGMIAVDQGKIAYVGKEDGELSARRVVDAEGLCLSPGFIDTHSHSDQSILEAPTRLHVLRYGSYHRDRGTVRLFTLPLWEGYEGGRACHAVAPGASHL